MPLFSPFPFIGMVRYIVFKSDPTMKPYDFEQEYECGNKNRRFEVLAVFAIS